ncbi:MAG: hypothetical protein NTV46_07205 [Verrucomicrobia bacterium]|nr:hypothetical protein [Verrucomicrobiota bacterium]
MYDRKTWVILALCGALLAVNLYYSGQNQRIQAEQKARQEAPQQSNVPNTSPTAATPPALTVEPVPPSAEEELVILKNQEVEFTLSNIGGGVKFAEFQNEFDVGSKTSRVRVNRFGPGQIGALAGAAGKHPLRLQDRGIHCRQKGGLHRQTPVRPDRQEDFFPQSRQ